MSTTCRGLVTLCALALLLALLAPLPAAATGDPPTLPVGSTIVPAVNQQHEPAIAFNPFLAGGAAAIDEDPPEFRSQITIMGEQTFVSDAIERYRELANDPNAGEAGRDWMTAAETAFGERLQQIVGYLRDNHPLPADDDTREIVSNANENFLGLRVALARRDDPRFNGIYERDAGAVGRLVAAAFAEGQSEPLRAQVITSNAGGGGGVHHVAADVYADPRERVLSIVVMDSTNQTIGPIAAGVQVPDDVAGIITHYASRQQTLCSGCREFSLAFAREMSGIDVHDRPLRKLVTEVRRTGRPERIPDEVGYVANGALGKLSENEREIRLAEMNERLGELPPQLFDLANSNSGWRRYRAAREAYLEANGDAAQVRDGLRELNRVEAEIYRQRVDRDVVDTRTGDQSRIPINLAVDNRRRDGFERLAAAFDEGRGGELIPLSPDEQRRQALARGQQPGQQQRQRYQALRGVEATAPDVADAVATRDDHDQVAASESTASTADVLLEAIERGPEAEGPVPADAESMTADIDPADEETRALADWQQQAEILSALEAFEADRERDRDEERTAQRDERPAELAAN